MTTGPDPAEVVAAAIEPGMYVLDGTGPCVWISNVGFGQIAVAALERAGYRIIPKETE